MSESVPLFAYVQNLNRLFQQHFSVILNKMPLFLTGVLPFLAHDHASSAAFLTCRYHNFHGSIIPEFLSDEDRVAAFCEVRQNNQLEPAYGKQYSNLYNLFIQTPLMQFSPSLIVSQNDCAELILKPLLATKYFTRTLQRCVVVNCVNTGLLLGLSKVQSLTKLDFGMTAVANEHLEIIVNSFPSIETLTICRAQNLTVINPETFAEAKATKTLRNLTMEYATASFAAHFVPHFPNLRKLVLRAEESSKELDLLPLASSLPLLTDLSLTCFNLENTESLKNLVHLSSIEFHTCRTPDTLMSVLTQENTLPELASLSLVLGEGLSTSSSFEALSHAPNLHVLTVNSGNFDTDSLQYLENMVHLRKLDLSYTNIAGDSRVFKSLMQNSFHQLEELNLEHCFGIGNHQGAIAEALYSTHSRLRVLILRHCNLGDDDLNGIGALKNTLEALDLSYCRQLTNEALEQCKDLVKLKKLNLWRCIIDDLSPLKDCTNLEKLDVSFCDGLTDDSFKVFSEEPNSFPRLCVLNLTYCEKLTEKAFEHLSKNNNLVHQLQELDVKGMGMILLSSSTARDNLCQLKGLRRLVGFFFGLESESDRYKVKVELMRSLKNLEEVR